MNTAANTLEESLVRSNIDYHVLMNQVREIELAGDKNLYQRLMDEADDLANYIHSLVSDN